MSAPGSPTPHLLDAPGGGEAQQLASALILAAQNAAQAAASQQTLSQQLMTQLNSMQPGAVSSPAGSPTSTAKFSCASKMVRMPDPFTANLPEAEQTAWPDFELNLQAWLGAADTGFEADLAWIEKNVDVEFDMEVHSDEMATRGKELH